MPNRPDLKTSPALKTKPVSQPTTSASQLPPQAEASGDTFSRTENFYSQLPPPTPALVETLQHLFRNGLDPDATFKNHVPPLFFATNLEHLPSVKTLLQLGADANGDTRLGFTPLHCAVMRNNLDIAEALLAKKADPNLEVRIQSDTDTLETHRLHSWQVAYLNGQTPLHLAIDLNSPEMAKLLMQSGADPNKPNGQGITPLQRALQVNSEITPILTNSSNPASNPGNQEYINLLEAIITQSPEKIENALSTGINPNQIITVFRTNTNTVVQWNGRNCLHAAIETGNVQAVNVLLKPRQGIKADPNFPHVVNDRTPLHFAVDSSDPEVALKLVNALLEAGANPNVADDEGYTPLHHAMVHERLEIIAALVKAGADPNQKAKDPNQTSSTDIATPLSFAAISNKPKLLQALLDAGADPSVEDSMGRTPLDDAVIHDHAEIIKKLLRACPTLINHTDKLGYTPLFIAAGMARTTSLNVLLDPTHSIKANPNQAVGMGQTPLLAAAITGNLPTIKALLRAGASSNGDEKLAGWTPLHAAIATGKLDPIQALLDAGADPNRKADIDPATLEILRETFYKKDASVFANVNSLMKGGKKPLHMAMEQNNTALLQALLNAGADPNQRDNQGRTPLMTGIILGSVECIKKLLAPNNPNKADVNLGLTDGSERTPLWMAAASGRTAIAELLLTRGAYINQRDKDGKSPLYIAIEKGHIELAKLLVKRGADPDAAVYNPLRLAIEKDYDELAELLLDKNADPSPSIRDQDGNEPIHLAAAKGKLKLVTKLLDKGSYLNSTNQADKTPLDLAKDQLNSVQSKPETKKYAAIVKLLEEPTKAAQGELDRFFPSISLGKARQDDK